MTGALHRRAVFAGVLLVLVAAPSRASDLRVLMSPESGITVGDLVRLVLEMELEPERQVSGSDLASWLRAAWLPTDLQGVELVAVGEPSVEVAESGSTWRQIVTLRAFRPGKVQLPPIEVSVLDADGASNSVSSGPLAITVESVLSAGEQTQPRPPAPVRSQPLGSRFWALASLLVIATVGSALAAVHLGAFASEQESRRRRDPLAELRLALQRLDPNQPEREHVGLSSSLRRFLERRTGTPALERTTTEIYGDLGGMPLADASRRQVRQILLDCDRVKFGAYPTSRDDLSERVRRTRSLAEQIEAHLLAREATVAATTAEIEAPPNGVAA